MHLHHNLVHSNTHTHIMTDKKRSVLFQEGSTAESLQLSTPWTESLASSSWSTFAQGHISFQRQFISNEGKIKAWPSCPTQVNSEEPFNSRDHQNSAEAVLGPASNLGFFLCVLLLLFLPFPTVFLKKPPMC